MHNEVWTVEKSCQNFFKMQQNWPYLILFIWYNIKKTEWAQKCAYQSCWKKKILHRETNGKLSFYCYSPQWITTTFFMKKTEWFPIWFFTIWEMNNTRQPQSKILSWLSKLWFQTELDEKLLLSINQITELRCQLIYMNAHMREVADFFIKSMSFWSFSLSSEWG